MYAAQATPQFDADIAEKGHLWMETNKQQNRQAMKPGTKRIIAGALLVFIGVVVVPMALILPLFGTDTGQTRFRVPGSIRVDVDEPGRYYLWNEYKTIFDGKTYNRSQSLPDGLVIRIFNADTGRPIPFETDTNISSTTGARASNAIGYIDLEQPGTVVIDVSGGDQERIFFFSRSILQTLMMRVFGSVVGAMAGLLAGLGLIIWGVIRLNQPDADSPAGLPATDDDQQARTWAILCHLSALAGLTGIPFGNILGPLIVWLIKKDQYPFADAQGRESLNFQISMTLYTMLAGLLCFVLIGFLLLPVLLIANLVLVIRACLKTNKGAAYQYPLTIRLIR